MGSQKNRHEHGEQKRVSTGVYGNTHRLIDIWLWATIGKMEHTETNTMAMLKG